MVAENEVFRLLLTGYVEKDSEKIRLVLERCTKLEFAKGLLLLMHVSNASVKDLLTLLEGIK